ncbi:sensor histidine kinase [Thalassotalea marina]|uniref:histidine kinase n=1 Tax=Thalassotalea marina TaxID=1673741 RepID=A0A919BP39_9GAMM|nr:ATP-binding protein [Thalassotalea marina]GHG00280.1 sensor histidine kinase [Thalassotalea marina]
MRSLEKYLSFTSLVLAIPGAVFLGLLTTKIIDGWQAIVVTQFFYWMFVWWMITVIKFRSLRAFTRASLHLDAIRQEDFNQFAKSSFPEGKVKEFHHQLNELSSTLQQQKSRYDQHIFLVYQLISQLASPILVFNQRKQLSFANEAFYQLFGQPWQVHRNATPEHLGLNYKGGQWYLEQMPGKWQIKHSEFDDNGESNLLLIFVDIESALRENQLKAWQQIIRVLSHEIRNSLTPVSSMAETLAEKSLVERDKQILQVITDRCSHLQNFVDRYSTLSKKIELNKQVADFELMLKALTNLFTDINIKCNRQVSSLWVDITFFEQVLINLIKNAKEAQAKNITINIEKQDQHIAIEIIDDGHGFANLDNAFVPLFTTKADGQGIGLSFCRNIIEQHGGVIELHNNSDKGVTILMVLPVQNQQ